MKAWLFVTVAAVLVFQFFGAGTTYSLLIPDYPFADGELPAEAGILTGSLALAAFGARRLSAADRRVLVEVADFGAWLPRRDGSPGFDGQAARLRRTARRAAGITVVWAVLFAGGLAAVITAGRAAADLLATGVRVDGSVVSVHDPARGTPTLVVRYGPPGASRTAEIARDSGHEYHEGEAVTVVYDQADPARVRTTTEANENEALVNFGVVSLVAGFIGLPLAASVALGWRRRARAVAQTGWRSATVTVFPGARGGQWIEAGYRDGTGIELRCVPSLRRPGGLVRHRAWIGGWGRQMVVLFPNDPDGVPVRAVGLRGQSISPVR